MSSAAKADTSKKSRREIANHNERRRMQSINTGFEQLRDVLPAYREAPSDRLSKAAVLSKAHEYILELQQQNQQMQLELMHHRSGGAPARGVSHVYPGYPHSEMMGSGGSSPPAHTQRLPRSRGASLSPPLSVSEGAQLATPPRPQAAASASVSRAMYREPVASPPRRHSAPLVAVEADDSGRGVKRRRTQSVATADRPESGQSLDVMLQAIAALETTRGTGPMQTPSPGTAPSVGFQSWPGSSGAMVVDGGMRVSPKKPPASGSDQPSKMSISRRLLLTVA